MQSWYDVTMIHSNRFEIPPKKPMHAKERTHRLAHSFNMLAYFFSIPARSCTIWRKSSTCVPPSSMRLITRLYSPISQKFPILCAARDLMTPSSSGMLPRLDAACRLVLLRAPPTQKIVLENLRPLVWWLSFILTTGPMYCVLQMD